MKKQVGRREWRFLACGVLAVALTGLMLPGMAAPAAPESAGAEAAGTSDASVREWSQAVWQSAIKGDRSNFYLQLENAPLDGLDGEFAAHFRDQIRQHESNLESARQDRVEARAKALKEMREHVRDENLSKALRSAVEVQTLSEDMDAVLDDPEFISLIEWAESEIPGIKEDGDILHAQEVLFRLRTLFDETDRIDQYQQYHEQLERVNHRLSLLARYGPKHLHELRDRAALRAGEESLGPFVAANAIDWEERVEGIDHRMLRDALRNAASDHFDTGGWRPLLKGGLDGLMVFATTTGFEDTFPALKNQGAVGRFVDGIREQKEDLGQLRDRELNSWRAGRIIDRVLSLNEDTINLPESVIFREFGDGAMSTLDQYSEVIWPDRLRRFRQMTQGNFVGVGIEIRHNDGREIVVSRPLEGTPAFFAGVKPGDIIAEVDGKSTVGWSLNDAVERITGPRGETVTLGIRRDGHDDLIRVPIERDTIKLRSVQGWWKTGLTDEGDPEWDWFIDPVSRIGYVMVSTFNEGTFEELRQAWQEMSRDSKPHGLILDLRFNPGGPLTSAVQVSNMFLRSGVIVSGETKDGRQAWPDQRARPSAAEIADVPTVVLINRGSASGSEIVAGALQAHGAAVVVGERTFGKGSVQTVHPIAANAALKLTTHYYRLPPGPGDDEGRLVHRFPGAKIWGVDPDFEVTMTPDQIIKSLELRQEAEIFPEGEDGKPDPNHPDRPHISSLLTDGLDPQLETALLILQARTLGTVDENRRHAAR